MIADVELSLVAILRKSDMRPAQQLAYHSMTGFGAAALGVGGAVIVVAAAVAYAAAVLVVHAAAASYQPECSMAFDFPNLN